VSAAAGDAVDRVIAHSQQWIEGFHPAAACLTDIPFPTIGIWIDTKWAVAPEQMPLRAELLADEERAPIEGALEMGERALTARAVYALCDRFAGRTAACKLVPELPESVRLSHSPLGQPITRRSDSGGADPLHISFTHDGDMHFTLAVLAPRLKGVGVDVVHLPRLCGERKDREYLHRFGRKFMSDQEYAGFTRAADSESLVGLRIRVAAHFSLMEAASKALGTGLKIGVGMGGPESVPKQSIGVCALGPAVEFQFGAEPRARMQYLNAESLTGYWSANAEYLVSAAVLE